jgi:hypothetical protein
MESSERHFFHHTERTYHCIIMHIFKKQKQKQSIIKLNKQSINLTCYAMWIDFRNKNMFRSCIMKLKWTNSNVATSPIFDGLQSTTIWLWSSSVIRIVKMKYNRINIKWWLVSTSFKILYVIQLSDRVYDVTFPA